MTEVKYSNEQVKELKNNQCVKNCTNRHIVFTKEFKFKAIELSKKYISRKEIFKQFGFPEYIINSYIPKNSISRWKRNVKIKGVIQSMSRR